MKETLKIKQIKDGYKDKDGESIHTRYVEISHPDSLLKVIFNGEFGDLPIKIRSLDEEVDLGAEVEVELNFNITSKQTRLA